MKGLGARLRWGLPISLGVILVISLDLWAGGEGWGGDGGGSGGSQAFSSRPEYRGTLGVDLALTRWQCPHPETPTPPPQPARQRTR